MLSIGYIILIVVLSLCFIVVCIICCFAVCCVLKCRQTRIVEMERRQRYADMLTLHLQKIDFTLQCMRQGVYSNIANPYTLESCIICLDEFDSKSVISITNECKHMFHTSCLKDWYKSIEFNRSLRCPMCKTFNKPFRILEESNPNINNNAFVDSRGILIRNNENRVSLIFTENAF